MCKSNFDLGVVSFAEQVRFTILILSPEAHMTFRTPVFEKSSHSEITIVAISGFRGRRERVPLPLQPKLLHFHAVIVEIGQIISWSPLRLESWIRLW